MAERSRPARWRGLGLNRKPVKIQIVLLLDDHAVLFERYRDTLLTAGVPLETGRGGEAGLGDFARGIWHGAKEALRQATYWPQGW